MKLHKSIIIAALNLFCFASCTNELDQMPPQSLTSNLIFTNITTAQSALDGAYAPLRNTYYYGRNFTIMGDLITDNLIATSWFGNSYTDWQKLTCNSGTYEARDLWSTLYNAINRTNSIIKQIDEVAVQPGEDPVKIAATKRTIKAQAFALRALFAFDLLRTYSKIDLNEKLGIPMVTAPTTEIAHARKTVRENYNQIVQDLKDAENLLGDDNITSQVKINKYVINALLSRIYLYYKDYDLAIQAADKVTTGGFGYESIADNFNKIWTDDISTKEIIFKPGIDPVKESGAVNLGVFFINDSGGSLKPNPDYVPSQSLISLYADNDLRKNAFLKSYTVRQYTTPVVLVNKYPGNPLFKAYSDKSNAPKLLRYAEVQLNKMEAAYYTNKTLAKTLLKEIRQARITGYSVAVVDSYDDATLLKEIKLERRRELAFEGHQFFDLKRWRDGFVRNKDGDWQATENAIGEVSATNYRWQWPIPQAERESNKLAEQNPGYAN